ncbi:uncharacterized protein CXQ87_000694 [Candidozyma duobushaemuli]|uniref:Actin-like protein ARP6 n=2 Tax=Candidozyma TaxID=3303203 RepID=A0ABX8I6K8_9ASCO|nr:uncharacterized protein CXQ87_000694 [[Candida] duobushaemulonis]PVH17796.1 hypothetical protein CXQ87_000694 [[Candida] duobushaemulonis]QWU86396.1 hypothetical protein CA3LBN_000614 [[Candida] haemuloni]
MTKQHLILDNGSYDIKAGFATQEKPLVIHNALAKARDGVIYVGNDYISHTNLYSGINFRRPHDSGHLTSWEVEKTLWDYTFDQLSPKKELDLSNIHLTLTESAFQLPQLSMNTDLIVFEEYGFGDYYRCVPSSLVPWEGTDKPADFTLVVDCGFSSTWVVPILYQVPYWRGIRKLPIGGRHLNGLLRETTSFRHYDISDEPILLNTLKEKTMFVAENFESALRKKLNYKCEFVLPDFKTTFTGYVKAEDQNLPTDAQTLKLYDERFTIPEAYFHPEIMLDNNSVSNSPMIQNANFKSLTDLVVDSIASCPEATKPLLSANINIVGGSSYIPNLPERLISELKKELPVNWEVRSIPQNQNLNEVAWYGGTSLVKDDLMKEISISKQDYFEHGANWCQKQFGFKNFS